MGYQDGVGLRTGRTQERGWLDPLPADDLATRQASQGGGYRAAGAVGPLRGSGFASAPSPAPTGAQALSQFEVPRGESGKAMDEWGGEGSADGPSGSSDSLGAAVGAAVGALGFGSNSALGQAVGPMGQAAIGMLGSTALGPMGSVAAHAVANLVALMMQPDPPPPEAPPQEDPEANAPSVAPDDPGLDSSDEGTDSSDDGEGTSAGDDGDGTGDGGDGGDGGTGDGGDGGTGDGGGGGDGGTGDGGDGGTGDGGDGGGYANGGLIPGHTVGADPLNIHVDGGEYVIPTDVVDQLGAGYFDQLVAGIHTPVARRAGLARFNASQAPRAGLHSFFNS